MNTPLENAKERWLDEHIGMCGTCIYRKKRMCDCERSDFYGDRIESDDACGEYLPEKGVLL